MLEAYSEDTIKTLDWKEHIRRRPGMYIGKLGDGSSQDDGIYILLKEVFDNSIDEYMMGNGKRGKEKREVGRCTDILSKEGDKWILIGDHGGEFPPKS